MTMATNTTAPLSPSPGGKGGENTGRWTTEEHRLFLLGLEKYGKGWKDIASLVKSRTVVQIRTHAQKYFQKLAKARQNGEEGEVSMGVRGGVGEGVAGVADSGPAGAAGAGPNPAKRRRQSGTKRKANSSVNLDGEGKITAAAAGPQDGQPTPVGNVGVSSPLSLPPVASALAPFVVQAPVSSTPVVESEPRSEAITGVPEPAPLVSVPGSVLEDSLFRFLTPSGGAPSPAPMQPTPDPLNPQQVNTVARQAGANPITLPPHNPKAAPENSPTGVTDVYMFPTWAESKNQPAWNAKGDDVDELLNDPDALAWLADPGDVNEVYQPPPPPKKPASAPAALSDVDGGNMSDRPVGGAGLPASSMPPPPPLYESSGNLTQEQEPPAKKAKLSSGSGDENFSVFDEHFDEQAFVSALLENNGESTFSLPTLS